MNSGRSQRSATVGFVLFYGLEMELKSSPKLLQVRFEFENVHKEVR